MQRRGKQLHAISAMKWFAWGGLKIDLESLHVSMSGMKSDTMIDILLCIHELDFSTLIMYNIINFIFLLTT